MAETVDSEPEKKTAAKEGDMPELNLDEVTQSDIKRWGSALDLKGLDKLDKEEAAEKILVKANKYQFDTLGDIEGLQKFMQSNGYDDKGTPPKWVTNKAKANGSEDTEAGKGKSKKGAKNAEPEDDAGESEGEGDGGGEVVNRAMTKEERAQVKALCKEFVEDYHKGMDDLSKTWVDVTMALGEKVQKIKDIAKAGGKIEEVEAEICSKTGLAYREVEDYRRLFVSFNDKRELLEGVNQTKARALLTAADPVKVAQKGIPNPEPEGKKTLKVQDKTVTSDQLRRAIRAQVVAEGGEASKRGKKVNYNSLINYAAKYEKNWARAKSFMAEAIKKGIAPNSKQKKAMQAQKTKLEAVLAFYDEACDL